MPKKEPTELFQPETKNSFMPETTNFNKEKLESIDTDEVKIEVENYSNRQSKATTVPMTPFSFTSSCQVNIPLSRKPSTLFVDQEDDTNVINLDSQRGLIEIQNFTHSTIYYD